MAVGHAGCWGARTKDGADPINDGRGPPSGRLADHEVDDCVRLRTVVAIAKTLRENGYWKQGRGPWPLSQAY